MPEFSESTIAFGKLIFTFGCMLVMLRFNLALWKALLVGCALIALLTGLPLAQWVLIPLHTIQQSDLIILELMVFGILILSGVQGATGQSRRLVESIERFIRWPRVRLVIFPAMVGFLPMPGGALFSCPMLDAAAHDMDISPRRKVLINYWFRHIWEVSWPLYPGYVLASSLLGLDLMGLLKYTFPLVLMAIATGWFFLLRDIKPPQTTITFSREESRAALKSIFYESLPLIITLAGAALFGFLLGRFAPFVPSQAAFLISVYCGVGMALWQGRGKLDKPLRKLALNANTFRLLLVLFAIFVFKDIINASGIVGQMSRVGDSTALVLLLFIALPLFCGALTGIMVGYVGACFPILLGIMAKGGLTEYTLPLVILALTAGNIGMLISPLHVCFVVTLEYFKTAYVQVWRSLIAPLAVQLGYGVAWSLVLYFIGAHF